MLGTEAHNIRYNGRWSLINTWYDAFGHYDSEISETIDAR